MYYVLESKNIMQVVRHLKYSGDKGWGFDFLKGEIIDLPKQGLTLYVHFERDAIELPDYFEVDGAPIVNEKFLKTLQIAKIDNFQNFPIEIQFNDRKLSGYSLFNVIGRIDCLDKDLSDISKFGPSIVRIFSLKLNKLAAQGAMIFRESNYQELIFISEALKNAIEKLEVSGCEIRQADGWSDLHRF